MHFSPSFIFGNADDTAIHFIDTPSNIYPSGYYTLEGVKVSEESQLRKNAIYIKDGKKFIVK